MLKKFTALLLVSAFTHVYAYTPIQQTKAISEELNRSFDELNYRLNVEWDQKDSQFFEQVMNDFEKDVSRLQKDGMSNKELIDQALERIKDKQVQAEVSELAKTISDNQMSSDEARAFTLSKLNNTYAQGASWSGHRMGGHTAMIFGAILIIILICHHKHKHDPEPQRPVDNCHDTWDMCSTYPGDNCQLS